MNLLSGIYTGLLDGVSDPPASKSSQKSKPKKNSFLGVITRSEPDFPIGLRGLSLGPRGKGGPAVGPPTLKKKEKKKSKNKKRTPLICTVLQIEY